MSGTKVCGKCGEVRGFADFARDQSRVDGLQACCRGCKRAAYRERVGRPVRPYGGFGRSRDGVDRGCLVDGCERSHVAHGYCQPHSRRYREGKPLELRVRGTEMLSANVGYRAAHKRCSSLWGRARRYPCMVCYRNAHHWSYDHCDPSELEAVENGYVVKYSVWPEFYRPMCASCHKLTDG